MLPFPWIVFWKDPPITPCQRDIPLGLHVETGESILADLWSPPDTVEASGLGLIYLHGSGWHYADKDFGTRHFFRHLASQGHVILDVAYTLAPRADLFGMVGDVKRAIHWMKRQAQDIGVHPDRVVLAGGSAGGHLALLAAYTPNHSRLDPADIRGDTSVRGVISYYGPADLRQQYDRFMELPGLSGKHRFERKFMTFLENRFEFEVLPVHDLLPSFLRGTPLDAPDIYDLASPCEHVNEQCPPTLLLQGTHDFSGVTPQVHHLHEALMKVGCSSFLMEFPDTEHGFDLYKPNWSPAAQAATFITERFLAHLA